MIGNTLGQELAVGTPAPVVGTVGAGGTNTSDSAPDVFWRSNSPDAGQAEANLAITAALARSTAQLVIPANTAVKKAYLYTAAYYGSLALPTSVTLQAGTSDPVSLSLDQVFSFSQRYQTVTDITSIVQTNGSAQYTVSGVQSVELANLSNANVFAGWSMVVFYEDVTQPFRRFYLNDGLSGISSVAPYSDTYSGLVEITGSTQLGIVAYDGDNVSTGDYLKINGNTQSNLLNPADNFFNSSHSINGVAVSTVGDLPQLTGTAASMSGIDLDVIDVSGSVPLGSSSYSLDIGTAGDIVFLGVLVASVDSYPPPSVTALASSSTICAGSSVSLSAIATDATPPYNYTWIAPPGALLSGSATSAVSATLNPAGTQTFTVIVGESGANNLSTMATVEVTVSSVSALSVSINPANPVIPTGQSITLSASGAGSYSWSTGESTPAISVSTVGTYSVTGLSGCASATASVEAKSADCDPTTVAKAISATQTAVLSPNACSVQVKCNGYGNTFIIKGPNEYVFSAVYREAGTYSLNTVAIRQPGTYTFTAFYQNTCGQTSSDTLTYIVTGTACP